MLERLGIKKNENSNYDGAEFVFDQDKGLGGKHSWHIFCDTLYTWNISNIVSKEKIMIETIEVSNLMTLTEVASMLGWSRNRVYRQIKRGRFPTPAISRVRGKEIAKLWEKAKIEALKKAYEEVNRCYEM